MPDNVDTFLAIIANAEDLADVYKYIRRMNDSEIIAIYDKLLLQELLQIDLPSDTSTTRSLLCIY
jgi:hypothetical protein